MNMRSTILVIDNYDSFTYNLVQCIGKILPFATIRVFRNDAIGIEDIKTLCPNKIIISPGPCTPKEAGISTKVIQTFFTTIPIFGVCLGCQCIMTAFGGKIKSATQVMHGKRSIISNLKGDLFKDIPQSFSVVRYHSLVLNKDTLPDEFQVIAYSDDDHEIMGIQHLKYPHLIGVQFHPESISTDFGEGMIQNFLSL